MNNLRPKVTIVCVTYNQEEYVKQALDSFVMQDVNFAFEVVIADDASTDNTSKIIEKYSQKHPDIFRPILRRKNVGVAANFFKAFQEAKGEYIALCEGDDYWTDPKKLQRQVDFMESHSDYALCFHPVKVVYENDPMRDEIYPAEKEGFTLDKLVGRNFIQTNSVVYRAAEYNNLPEDILPVDWYLHLLHAKRGKIGFIDRTMSVYRRHEGGIWWMDGSSAAEYNFLRKNYVSHQRFYAQAGSLLDNKEHRRQMQYQAIALLERIIRLDLDKQQTLLSKIIKESPDTLHFALDDASGLISDLHRRNHEQSQLLTQQKMAIERLEKVMDGILNSRTYKISKTILKPLKAIKDLVAKI